jgi:hypothetical protein
VPRPQPQARVAHSSGATQHRTCSVTGRGVSDMKECAPMARKNINSLAGLAAAAGLAALSLAGATTASAATPGSGPATQARIAHAYRGMVLSRSAAGTVSWRTPAAVAGATTLASTADQSPGRTGAATVITIADPAAPSTYRFPLSLPHGSTAALQADGSVLITRAGQPLGSFRPPWAKDATGRALPTSYTLAGSAGTGYTLIQHVSTAGATFPVTADPHYTWGWVTGTIYFNKKETKFVAVGVGVAQFFASLTGPWAPLLRGYVTVIGAVAGTALAEGKCVDFKSTGTAHVYGGSQGDGYCR